MPPRILIANRGEIAIRIARSLIETNHIPVGIYTSEDVNSLHRRFLVEDIEVSSYLNIKDIVKAAIELGADAIHPGYGFLSEKPEFATEILRKGIVFIGPHPNTMVLCGDKIASKAMAEKLEVPTLPWIEVKDAYDVIELAKFHGYPILIKSAGGGGGKGKRIIRNEKEIETAIEIARKEAERSFKDARIYAEPYIEHAKHIEVQVLGDGDNEIHLYERECSIQRKFQKVVEEAPSPSLREAEREKLYNYALRIATGLKYLNAGTIEFIYDVKRNELYFMEVNPRLQVEHPVTEMITRVDIVKKQVEIALYHVLDLRQNSIHREGHAIELRIYAENPYTDEPSPGIIRKYREPSGPGIRVDSGVTEGSKISDKYDPLISKLIVWGIDRNIALSRLERALKEYIIDGISTNIVLLKQLIRSPSFIHASYTTKTLEEETPNMFSKLTSEVKLHAVILATLLEHGDKGVEIYTRKKSRIKEVLESHRVTSLKRAAWYYYITLRSTLGKQYMTKKHRSKS